MISINKYHEKMEEKEKPVTKTITYTVQFHKWNLSVVCTQTLPLCCEGSEIVSNKSSAKVEPIKAH